MLRAIGITHVVSVGESLINCPPDCDPMYGHTANTLCAAARNGDIKVYQVPERVVSIIADIGQIESVDQSKLPFRLSDVHLDIAVSGRRTESIGLMETTRSGT
jgi:hypothetical protein